MFAGFAESSGSIDRVIVNAGLGKGAPLGTGRADVTREAPKPTFVGSLAPCVAALEGARGQGRGPVVLVS